MIKTNVYEYKMASCDHCGHEEQDELYCDNCATGLYDGEVIYCDGGNHYCEDCKEEKEENEKV